MRTLGTSGNDDRGHPGEHSVNSSYTAVIDKHPIGSYIQLYCTGVNKGDKVRRISS